MKEQCSECALFTCITDDKDEKVIMTGGDIYQRNFEIGECVIRRTILDKKERVDFQERKAF